MDILDQTVRLLRELDDKIEWGAQIREEHIVELNEQEKSAE